MSIDIRCLGPAAQKQVLDKLAAQEKQRRTRTKITDGFDSNLERDYYNAEIWPLIQTGKIKNVETHKTFLLLPALEYCGIKLPKAAYTPDFYIEYASGVVEVVETKSRAVRKLQRDYIYRRRLFIELYAKPNGWIFKEIIKEDN